MIFLARIIHMVFGLYAAGLIAYVILGYINVSWTPKIRMELGKFYVPLLDPIQKLVKPVKIGNALVDFSPFILLLAIMVVRSLLLGLLVPGF